MSRRGSSQNKQLQRMDRMDPFAEMHQMMRGFGGFENDGFFGSMMGMRGGDPFQDMFKFSDVHKNMHGKGVEGSYVCQSYVSSSKMGPDGKIVREDYFENSMGQHAKGNTISQKQQAYKNNSGVNRIAEERMLNDKGRKMIKQKNHGGIEQTNHYYNIDEEDAGRFDQEWQQVNNSTKFLENHKKYVQQLGPSEPRNLQLGYGQNYDRAERQPRNQEPRSNKRALEREPKPSESNYSGSRGSKRNEGLSFGSKH